MITLNGTIVSGIGKGGLYISLKGYMDQFRDILGLTPYPGTLNVKLDEESKEKYSRLMDTHEGKTLIGFKVDDKEYGDVKVFSAELEELKCYIVAPNKSIHEDTAELVSDRNLRTELGLQDGDSVTVHVHQNSSVT